MKSIINSAFHAMLISSLIVRPVHCHAEPTQAQLERYILLEEIQANREMIQTLFQMVARLDPANAATLETLEAAALNDAKQFVDDAADFATDAGKRVRDELAKKAEAISKLQPTKESSKETVDAFLKAVEEAKDFAKKELQNAQDAYREATSALPPKVASALTERLNPAKLESLGKQKLAEALKKLDPTLDLEQLAKLPEAQLAQQIIQFGENGRWTPELVASLGAEGFKNLTGQTLPGEYVGVAASLADVHRATNDFGGYATNALTAAIATGNPYVIAAVAAILALIALFKALFGGGHGKGKGKGSKGRNSGSSVPVNERGATGVPPETPAAAKPPKPEGVDLAIDDGGEFGVVKAGGVLKFYIPDTGAIAFTVPIASIRLENGAPQNILTETTINRISAASATPVRSFDVALEGRTISVAQLGDNWVMLDGEPYPPNGTSADGLIFRKVGTVLKLYENNRPYSKGGWSVNIDLKNGVINAQNQPVLLAPASIQSVVSIEPEKHRIVISIKGPDGITREKVLEDFESKWLLSDPIVAP